MSKLKIGTARFQNMVARAVKGASENKLLPITSMMCIQLKDGVLSLTTTDTANTLVIKAQGVEGDDMYAVVPVKQFSGLIAKTTSDSLELNLSGSDIEVRGNGVHKIALPADEDGMVRFPEYSFEKEGEGNTIQLSSIKEILNINKASVAKTIDTPCLCGYYLGDKVISTDEMTICFNDTKLVDGEYLVSPEMMDLLGLATQENISWWYKDGEFLFETEDLVLFGAEHDGKDLFPSTEVQGYLEEKFPSVCELPRLYLQSVIDRLSLFIEPYDKNGAYFTFTSDGVKITSKKSSSDETISYVASTNFAPFRCCVDIPMFKELIDANPGDNIELWYGHEACIKMTSGKVTQVIALLEDDSMEASDE